MEEMQKRRDEKKITDELVKRFFRYTAISSQSNDKVQTLPSSPGQMALANVLQEELLQMELEDILLTNDAILSARLPGQKDLPAIGFVAHLDTVDIGESESISPQILRKEEGKDVLLNVEKGIFLREEEIPEITLYQGQEILFTDGTSVLGADNKASIAILMTLAHFWTSETPIRHGDIYFVFVPDEEIGLRGAKALDPSRLPVEAAYTIDSNQVGEMIYETFHAASASISIVGKTAHPMSAKNILVNPLLIATEAIQMLDKAAMPEHTEGREGYIWPTDLLASPKEATLILNIRDHDKQKFEAKKKRIHSICDFLRLAHPKAQIHLAIEDVYSNILDALGSNEKPAVLLLREAMENLGIEVKEIAMRGGTDGSALSAKGIPTPNYFTGAHQFHSIYEFLPLHSFYLAYAVTEELLALWARK